MLTHCHISESWYPVVYIISGNCIRKAFV